ncbi:T9SS type A sorting domain-containing protein [Candidatus Latescibacterota bacterium]
MRKMLIAMVTLLIMSTVVFAVDFSPTLLKLTAPETVQYDFDNSVLEIPVIVSGTPSLTTFFVYTKDMGSNITDIRNGHLGWHYVNKIDTCVYFSGSQLFETGSQVISWDGNDQDGNIVPSGEYTYYLWGFDNQSPKQKVMFFAKDDEGNGQDAFYPYLNTNMEETGEDGLPLSQPLFHQANKKWTIGNDPLDFSLLETTNIVYPEGWGLVRKSVFDPTDHSIFYIMINNKEANSQKVQKWAWTPNGDAVVDDSWGEDLVFSNPHYGGAGPATNRDILYASYYSQYENGSNVNLYTIDFDGSLIQELDLSPFFTHPEDYEKGAQMSGGPRTMVVRDGYAFLNHFGSCIKAMVNPIAEDEEDFFSWVNENGDYIVDHNFELDSELPWVCMDFNKAPYNYTMAADANHFCILPCYDLGAVTFALLAPDGTGIDYFAFAGETAGIKRGVEYIDNGSSYDGIYCDNTSSESDAYGTHFIAHDSIKGIITAASVSVEEGAAAFSVAQNSPNPFNPATTIDFTIPEAASVTVNIHNVAGQKVDNLVSEFKSAGRHTTTWDASEFSAGVYFYVVKAGEFSKTMKMTLIK